MHNDLENLRFESKRGRKITKRYLNAEVLSYGGNL